MRQTLLASLLFAITKFCQSRVKSLLARDRLRNSSPTNHMNRAFCITKKSRRRELGMMIINDQDPNSDSEEQNLTQSLTLKRRGLDMRIGPVGFAVIVSLWDCCRLSHSVLTNGLKCCHLLGRPVKPARSIIGSKEYPTFNFGKEQQLQNMFMPT